jgi:hypothetical protein
MVDKNSKQEQQQQMSSRRTRYVTPPAVRGLCCRQGAGHGHCSAAAADKNKKVAPGVYGLSDV